MKKKVAKKGKQNHKKIKRKTNHEIENKKNRLLTHRRKENIQQNKLSEKNSSN